MSQPKSDSLAELIQRFLDEQLEASPALRDLARHLATLTLQRLEQLERAEESPPEAPAPQAPSGPAPPAIVGPSAIVPLQIGNARVDIPVTGPSHTIGAAREAAMVGPFRHDEEEDYLERTARARSIDLERISTRCRVKATSCRHQILRQNQERDTPEEFESRQVMNDLIAQAKTIPDCFLWMFFRKGLPTSDEQLELIARCYEAVADTADLCHAIEPIDYWPDEDAVREALQLLSTTSSALRVSLEHTWLTQPDIDQNEVHQWLKLVTAEHRYHVRNHMQLSDPADPEVDAPAARELAREMLSRLKDQRARRERAERLLKKALYHAQKIRDAADSPYDEEPPDHDCQKVNEAIGALIALDPQGIDGMIRELAAIALPEAFPAGVEAHDRLVAAAAQNAADSKPQKKPTDEDTPQGRTWSDDVLQVRKLFGGGRIVVIGGEPRRDAIERMIDAFELDGVEWPQLTEHGSAEPMRAPISGPSTRLVVIIIKLTGHEHADRARDFARQASVPLVHMPAGYNPEQIAAEVLNQASGQLQST
ncbi:MAG: hypothetical protein NCW75_07625 [Phycisphaera sp.]|nr:MAG: hypothetical protein NCW75_07625 [Phycisphaera sp.]